MANARKHSGDDGRTNLLAGDRVRKDHPRPEALGAIDELNSAIGLARSWPLPREADTVLERIQHELFTVGAELASPETPGRDVPAIEPKQVQAIEAEIEHFGAQLPALRHFVLPGGVGGAAALYLARAICRRAERRVVTALGEGGLRESSPMFAYLNRLGDLLFVLARYVNRRAESNEVGWHK